MNFNIVENKDSYYEKYDLFVKAYNDGVKVRRIRDDLGLTSKRYQQYKNQALDEGKIRPRRDMKTAKYYTRTKCGNYIVVKREEGTRKMKSYGTYHTLEETLKVVEDLKKKNWKVD